MSLLQNIANNIQNRIAQNERHLTQLEMENSVSFAKNPGTRGEEIRDLKSRIAALREMMIVFLTVKED